MRSRWVLICTVVALAVTSALASNVDVLYTVALANVQASEVPAVTQAIVESRFSTNVTS